MSNKIEAALLKRDRKAESATDTLIHYLRGCQPWLEMNSDMESEVGDAVDSIIEAAIAGMEAKLLRDKE